MTRERSDPPRGAVPQGEGDRRRRLTVSHPCPPDRAARAATRRTAPDPRSLAAHGHAPRRREWGRGRQPRRQPTALPAGAPPGPLPRSCRAHPAPQAPHRPPCRTPRAGSGRDCGGLRAPYTASPKARCARSVRWRPPFPGWTGAIVVRLHVDQASPRPAHRRVVRQHRAPLVAMRPLGPTSASASFPVPTSLAGSAWLQHLVCSQPRGGVGTCRTSRVIV